MTSAVTQQRSNAVAATHDPDRAPAATIEDLEFLDSTGVGASEAAKRLGFETPHAMEQWLRRHDATDLWRSFKKREPGLTDSHARGPVTATPKTDEIRALLEVAQRARRKRTQNLAIRIAGHVDQLRELVDQEQRQEAERQAREAEKQAARDEIRQLKDQLKAARAKLHGHKPAPAASTVGDRTAQGAAAKRRHQHQRDVLARHGVTADDVRRWARSNGHEVADRGILPTAVVDAYDAARAARKAA